MRRASLWLLLILTATPAAAQSDRQDGSGRDVPTLRALRIEGGLELRLDGALDEPAWQDVDRISGFRQQEPLEGEPATEDTEVRVLYDGEYLYIGVRAFDSEPDRIVGRQLERDASLGVSRFGPSGSDDAVEIILDTFHDRRNAYYFATNPQGVLVDGLITDESHDADLNWDAVWDVRAEKTPEGWTAEFQIPLRSIRFPGQNGEQVWGFNVQRVVARKNEQSLWTAWSRENEGLTRVSRAGELTGLESLPGGLDLYVKPYVLGEAGRDYVEQPAGDVDLDGDIGLDAKLGLASGLVLDLTLNTDFAQVEADDEQIDLTRFRLFFPEKREFFLENAGIFQFGTEGFGHWAPDILLFFSRRIGLAEGQTVPILGGARLTGRAGRQTIGLLNVVTGEEESLGAPLTNFAVGRVKRDVGQRSYIGAIVTSRLEEGGVHNLTGGVDWNLWLSGPMVFEGFYARSSDSRPDTGDDYSWRATLDYTGDWLGWRVEHLEIGPEMEPGIGFIRRDDVAKTSGSLRLTPRPPIDGLRKIDIRNELEYVASAATRKKQDRRWEISISPELDSGDELDFEVSYQFQRLDEPDTIFSGVGVPRGDYEDWYYRVELSTSRARPVSVELGGGGGDFWDGDRWHVGGELAFDSPHIGFALGYEHNDVDVPGGAFTTDLVRGRVKLAANTRLFGNALVQYNSQTGAFSANLRINWIHRPGSDLFIVFNERRDIVGSTWNPESRAFIVKLTYLIWF
ncbi:MAG: carbohydrate binding family 9 domain-containing protein [Gemmatimonadota bacterium]|nr:MAG: carbohydrate binding family 9 domain-containing protein [Gemmatimonadota bacterium]